MKPTWPYVFASFSSDEKLKSKRRMSGTAIEAVQIIDHVGLNAVCRAVLERRSASASFHVTHSNINDNRQSRQWPSMANLRHTGGDVLRPKIVDWASFELEYDTAVVNTLLRVLRRHRHSPFETHRTKAEFTTRRLRRDSN